MQQEITHSNVSNRALTLQIFVFGFVIAVASLLVLIFADQPSCPTRPLQIEQITHHCDMNTDTLKRIESQRYGTDTWPLKTTKTAE